MIGVGAVSQRVVMVAASEHVNEIVASRRQVNEHGGYIGWTPAQLVRIVKELSGGATKVVRDHGGPFQDGSDDDDWVHAFDVDIAAGFDVLHLDVSKLPHDAQVPELVKLVNRYGPQIDFEIGGERDTQNRLSYLLDEVLFQTDEHPRSAIIAWGGEIWNDRQCGYVRGPGEIIKVAQSYRDVGVKTKSHNADWFGQRSRYSDVIDVFNIAPEFAGVETDAWLRVMSTKDADKLLTLAYASNAWERWFSVGEGTWFDRARCAVRYCMMHDEVVEIISRYRREADTYVRECIRDAIFHTCD